MKHSSIRLLQRLGKQNQNSRQPSIVSRTRSVIVGGASSGANVTVRSKPWSPGRVRGGPGFVRMQQGAVRRPQRPTHGTACVRSSPPRNTSRASWAPAGCARGPPQSSARCRDAADAAPAIPWQRPARSQVPPPSPQPARRPGILGGACLNNALRSRFGRRGRRSRFGLPPRRPPSGIRRRFLWRLSRVLVPPPLPWLSADPPSVSSARRPCAGARRGSRCAWALRRARTRPAPRSRAAR